MTQGQTEFMRRNVDQPVLKLVETVLRRKLLSGGSVTLAAILAYFGVPELGQLKTRFDSVPALQLANTNLMAQIAETKTRLEAIPILQNSISNQATQLSNQWRLIGMLRDNLNDLKTEVRVINVKIGK